RTARVEEDRGWPVTRRLSCNVARNLHGIRAVPHAPGARAGIPPLPDRQHRAVAAEPGVVEAEDDRLVRQHRIVGYQTLDRGFDQVGADELHGRCGWELAADPHLHDVRILAVIRDHAVQIIEVHTFHRAAIDMAAAPPVAELAEALAEATAVPCRVADRDPDDLRAFVSECTLGDFPDAKIGRAS